MESNNEEIVKAIQHYQDRLDRYVSSKSNDKVLNVLNKLEKLPIRTLHLEDTGVGRTVNALKKCGGQVRKAAKSMVAKWKIMVLEEEQAAEEAEAANEEEAVDSAIESDQDSSYSSENENYEVEQFENELNDLNDVDFNTEEINNGSSHNTNKKTKHDIRSDRDNYGESSNKHKESSNSKNKSERKRENDIVDENKYDKRKKSNKIELHNLENTKPRGDESKKKRDCGYDEDEKRKSKHEKSQLKRQRESSESESEEEKKIKSKKSHHKRDDSSDSESHHKKHKSKSSNLKRQCESSESESEEKKHKCYCHLFHGTTIAKALQYLQGFSDIMNNL